MNKYEAFKLMVDLDIKLMVSEEDLPNVADFTISRKERDDHVIEHIVVERDGHLMQFLVVIEEIEDLDLLRVSANEAARFVVESSQLLNNEKGNIVFKLASKLNLYPLGFKADETAPYLLLSTAIPWLEIRAYAGFDKIRIKITYKYINYDKVINIDSTLNVDEISGAIRELIDTMR